MTTTDTRRNLSDVTLAVVDTRSGEDPLSLFRHCLRVARFRNAFFFTAERPTMMPTGGERVPLPDLATPQDYAEFFLWDLPVYRPLFAGHLLLVPGGGPVVDPEAWTDDFLQYDYIGAIDAPRIGTTVAHRSWSLLSQALLDAVADLKETGRFPLPFPYAEDIALTRIYRDELEARGVRFAPAEITRRFQAMCAARTDGSAPEGSVLQEGESACVLPGGEVLQRLYDEARQTPSDFNEHVATLARLSSQCRHVTEFGLRHGVSTRGLLYGRPSVLVTYDFHPYQETARVLGDAAAQAGIVFGFVQEDVRSVRIAETDLLFIDTDHTYSQLRTELALHGGQVRKFLVFHDTTTFATRGGDGGRGIWPVIEEFLRAHREWRLAEKYENNHGLTVLERRGQRDAAELPNETGSVDVLPAPATSSSPAGGSAPPSYDGIAVYYHCFLAPGWEVLIHEQVERMKASGLYAAAAHIVYGVIGDEEARTRFEAQYGGASEVPGKVVILPAGPEDGAHEHKTLKRLHDDAVAGRFQFAWYLHTKGITQKAASVRDWRLLMEYFLLDRWREGLAALQTGADVYGVNWWTPDGPYQPVAGWRGSARPHFSGNFFAVRQEYVCRLPSPPGVFADKRENEFWVGRGSPNVSCAHWSDVEHYSQAYPENRYRQPASGHPVNGA